MSEEKSLEQAVADVREVLETIDEDLIRSSKDTIAKCNELTERLEVTRIHREEQKKTIWHRLSRFLGDDDSWVDTLQASVVGANDSMKAQAQEMLDTAIERKRKREEGGG